MASLGIDFSSTLGAVLLGYTFEVMLYGVTVLQTFIYFRKGGSARDGPLLRGIVIALFVLDAVHLSFTTHSIWHYVVENFANLLALLSPVWSLGAQCIVTAISDALIRFVFGQRIWKLSRGNIWLVTLIGVCSLASFVAAFAFGYKGIFLRTFAEVSDIKWLLITGLTSSVVVDAILAVSLCVLLARSRSGFARMDTLVTKLIVYGISTGAITVVCALLVLLTYVTMPNNFIWIAFFFVLGKLFLNSMLASLNARTALLERSGLPTSKSTTSHKGQVNLHEISRNMVPPTTSMNRMAVRVETTSFSIVEQKAGEPNQWDDRSSPVVIVSGKSESHPSFAEDF